MLKNKKKFVITTSLATAAIVAIGFEIDYTMQKINTLKKRIGYKDIMLETQQDLIQRMFDDLEKVEDIETLKNVSSYWKFILNTD